MPSKSLIGRIVVGLTMEAASFETSVRKLGGRLSGIGLATPSSPLMPLAAMARTNGSEA